MLRNAAGGGNVSDFPGEKNVTKMNGSTLLPLLGGVGVNFKKKVLGNT